MPDKPELISVPEDLTLIADDELQELETRATAEFDRVREADDVTAEALQSMMTLADGIDRLRAELSVRDTRKQKELELQRAKMAEQKEHLQARVHGAQDSGGDGGGPGGVATATAVDADGIAAAAARGVSAALVAALGDRHLGRDLSDVGKRATASLADARRFAPEQKTPKPVLAVTAGVDIPGMSRGAELPTIDALVDATHRRAKGMPVTRDGSGNEQLVATIRNEFQHVVDDRTSPRDIEELFRHLTSDDKKDALVAAGGWCAPSETRYDFFNIACEDGLIDLPTFGVSRGGIRFPVSPSLADVFGGVAFGGFGVDFTNASNPWLWTEDDDVAATGAAPRKPCIRVPCPEFTEERLECYGICLTAGNLTDDAYPEATANFLRLLMSAHSHAINQRLIATMESLSEGAVTGGSFAAGGQAYNAIVSGAELAATDYRARFGMCEGDVLELVIPQWIVGVIRADLARRTGNEQTLSVTQAQITSYFADRNIRVQYVNDWQVRGTGQFGSAAGVTAWPGTVDLMLYAAGTFIKGNGLSLDLGVVRDSVLNETNDHTAAWTEECHLVAKVGHESRVYSIAFDVSGDSCCDSTGLL